MCSIIGAFANMPLNPAVTGGYRPALQMPPSIARHGLTRASAVVASEGSLSIHLLAGGDVKGATVHIGIARNADVLT